MNLGTSGPGMRQVPPVVGQYPQWAIKRTGEYYRTSFPSPYTGGALFKHLCLSCLDDRR